MRDQEEPVILIPKKEPAKAPSTSEENYAVITGRTYPVLPRSHVHSYIPFIVAIRLKKSRRDQGGRDILLANPPPPSPKSWVPQFGEHNIGVFAGNNIFLYEIGKLVLRKRNDNNDIPIGYRAFSPWQDGCHIPSHADSEQCTLVAYGAPLFAHYVCMLLRSALAADREHSRLLSHIWSAVRDTCRLSSLPWCYFYHFKHEGTRFTIPLKKRPNEPKTPNRRERGRKDDILT